MADILIRDLAEATVVEIDRRAEEQGLSRAEYLRRRLDTEYRTGASSGVTDSDWSRFERAAVDLAESTVMDQAWS